MSSGSASRKALFNKSGALQQQSIKLVNGSQYSATSGNHNLNVLTKKQQQVQVKAAKSVS